MLAEKQTPSYLGHRKRLKEKFQTHGFTAFADYEILELALSFAIPRKDTKLLAKQLIKKFGSLKQIVDASVDELSSAGLSQNAAVMLAFLKEFAIFYALSNAKTKKQIDSVQTAVNYLKAAIGGEKIEKVFTICLDSGNRIIEACETEKGTVNKSALIPRKIAETALKYKASAIVLAHNHPGGTLKPSQQDIDSTKMVKEALKAIDVMLVDHIIVTAEGYFSFKEYGLL